MLHVPQDSASRLRDPVDPTANFPSPLPAHMSLLPRSLRRLPLVGAFAAALLFCGAAHAQTGTIEGRVLDDQGLALVGANVLVVDEEVGSAVGIDGAAPSRSTEQDAAALA